MVASQATATFELMFVARPMFVAKSGQVSIRNALAYVLYSIRVNSVYLPAEWSKCPTVHYLYMA